MASGAAYASRRAPSKVSKLLNTPPQWLTSCVFALIIAFLIDRFLSRKRRGNAKSNDTIGRTTGGAVLDSDWKERARRQAAEAAADRFESKEVAAVSSKQSKNTSPTGGDGPESVLDITTVDQWEQIRSDVANANQPLIVKFAASWCQPCKRIDPHYMVLACKYAKHAKFVRVDVDELEELSEEFEVDIMPSFLVLNSDGQEIDRFGGASEMKLQELIERHCIEQVEKLSSTKDVNDEGGDRDNNDTQKVEEVEESATTSATAETAESENTAQQVQESSETSRPALKSSSDHPGLSEFHAHYSAISDLYRQYIIASKTGEVEPAPIIPRSERGNVKIHLEVLNSTSRPIDVFWVDYMGREEWKGSAAPGDVWTQITWVGHPWTFRAQGGQILMHFVPFRVCPTTDKAVTVTRNGDAIHRFTILNPSYSSSKLDLACTVIDRIFPYPATSIKSVPKALEWSYRQMERERVNPRTLLKYLHNIVRSPADPMYRQIRTANRKFWQGVWCNAGRGVLHALGFEENGAYVEMGPPAVGRLSDERIKQISGVIRDLEKLAEEELDGRIVDGVTQPAGADGYGRAGFGRIGMN